MELENTLGEIMNDLFQAMIESYIDYAKCFIDRKQCTEEMAEKAGFFRGMEKANDIFYETFKKCLHL